MRQLNRFKVHKAPNEERFYRFIRYGGWNEEDPTGITVAEDCTPADFEVLQRDRERCFGQIPGITATWHTTWDVEKHMEWVPARAHTHTRSAACVFVRWHSVFPPGILAYVDSPSIARENNFIWVGRVTTGCTRHITTYVQAEQLDETETFRPDILLSLSFITHKRTHTYTKAQAVPDDLCRLDDCITWQIIS